MDFTRLIGFCVLAGVLVMLLRQMHPQMAALLSLAFGAMAVVCVLPQVRGYIEAISGFLEQTQLSGMYGEVMLKAIGIVLVTQMAAEACREMDAPSIARRAEFCGRIALLSVAAPVFLSLTQMAVDVLK